MCSIKCFAIVVAVELTTFFMGVLLLCQNVYNILGAALITFASIFFLSNCLFCKELRTKAIKTQIQNDINLESSSIDLNGEAEVYTSPTVGELTQDQYTQNFIYSYIPRVCFQAYSPSCPPSYESILLTADEPSQGLIIESEVRCLRILPPYEEVAQRINSNSLPLHEDTLPSCENTLPSYEETTRIVPLNTSTAILC
ncbi:uncharacterized protein LOC124808690 isoform X1 [Hydra vulgaris]|uniref:uncharacterized protein LOC124808690 isoform X1 n=1 Tax=Hydra vulgaris TaxID=6087 RepID=UPI001F5EE083|nr:uncharacterized protein LOC124808690 [Hydra vulgaris]